MLIKSDVAAKLKVVMLPIPHIVPMLPPAWLPLSINCQAHNAGALSHQTSFSLKSSRCCQSAEGSDSIRLTAEPV